MPGGYVGICAFIPLLTRLSASHATRFIHERELTAFLVKLFGHMSFSYVNSKYKYAGLSPRCYGYSYTNVTPRSSSRVSGLRYHRPEIDEIKRKWESLRDDEERAKFKEERKAFVTECQQVCLIFTVLLRPLSTKLGLVFKGSVGVAKHVQAPAVRGRTKTED